MSQETIETATNEQILGIEPETADAEPIVEAAKAQEEQRVPVSELIAERHARQQISAELDALRVATLRGIQAPQVPQEDPVDGALARIAKKAGWDDTMQTVFGPTLRPVLEELAYQRQQSAALIQRLEQQDQQIARLSESERALAQNQELSRLIPDLDKIGPKMLELIKDLPDGLKKQYLANPQLLLPIAAAVRTNGGVTPAGRKTKAELSVDTGGAPSQPLTVDATTLAGMNPNSKEFLAFQRSFFGN